MGGNQSARSWTLGTSSEWEEARSKKQEARSKKLKGSNSLESMTSHALQQQGIFLFVPRPLPQRRHQRIYPAFPTFFVVSSRDMSSNVMPIDIWSNFCSTDKKHTCFVSLFAQRACLVGMEMGRNGNYEPMLARIDLSRWSSSDIHRRAALGGEVICFLMMVQFERCNC